MSSPFLRPTPFHSRVAALAHGNAWERWQGYMTPRYFESVSQEYFAIRNAASLYDVSPLIKYRVTGADAAHFVDHLTIRDVARCRVGQAIYTGWCDDDGKLIEDGTLFRLADHDFLLNAALHNLHWLRDTAYGLNVTIEDQSDAIAGLSLQGPQARAVLAALGLREIDRLAFMHLTEVRLDGHWLRLSRTGFTGDLGYELWIEPADADWLWDRLMIVGSPLGLLPIGSAALDQARVEAGFILVNVDYISSTYAQRQSQKRSPFELGLGWAVNFRKPYFVGKRALAAERRDSTARHSLVGLDIEGRKPAVDSFVYRGGKHIGRTTSALWSATLKRNIAIASVERRFGEPGSDLEVEIWYPKELKIERSMMPARVVPRPFYDPPRRRA